MAALETKYTMKQSNKIISALTLVCILSGCGLSGLPKVAEAAKLVCDSLSTFDHITLEVNDIKELIDKGQYSDALIKSKLLYNSYKDFPNAQSVKELESLVTLLENLV